MSVKLILQQKDTFYFCALAKLALVSQQRETLLLKKAEGEGDFCSLPKRDQIKARMTFFQICQG